MEDDKFHYLSRKHGNEWVMTKPIGESQVAKVMTIMTVELMQQVNTLTIELEANDKVLKRTCEMVDELHEKLKMPKIYEDFPPNYL